MPLTRSKQRLLGLPANDNPKVFDPGVPEGQELDKDHGIITEVSSKSWEMVCYSLFSGFGAACAGHPEPLGSSGVWLEKNPKLTLIACEIPSGRVSVVPFCCWGL